MVLLLFQVWSPGAWSLAGLGRYCYCSRLHLPLPHVSGGDQDDTSTAVNMAADFAVWSGASATPALGLGRRMSPWHLWHLLQKIHGQQKENRGGSLCFLSAISGSSSSLPFSFHLSEALYDYLLNSFQRFSLCLDESSREK